MNYFPSIFIGNVTTTPQGLTSAITKKLVDGNIKLFTLGLEGDEQAETRFHGGSDRALCHYPQEHYTYWSESFPELADFFNAPVFGENISTVGMTEDNVFIGDIYQWGNTLIQVTQPRSPCYKLNTVTGISHFSQIMQDSGYCGWLYRVISTGDTGSHHPLVLVSRNSDVSVKEAIAIAFHMPFDETLYRRLLGAAGLSASWCKTMQLRLQNEKIESFEQRLFKKS
ncbi:6-hydroxyaminopurine reductase [Proteus myxofaciens]|uniref:MOSC domain-containing protein n=1 Tax=Proteus myxofaciens ATCC 19692 TaxID=1354337 RepID=A0A198FXW7_9GAMM|nr:6-hydroxyaminopurine reductase [Proteus myxofaciens]OAT29912.1 hypothetical protein M983_1613 [Proteus myxofaciens ATCC 19692]